MGNFNAKLVADPVHGTIGLSDLELKIIGTRAFQRLRSVKQLGLASYVFPTADYSRFSHSLGVCHITGRILEALRENAGVDIPDDEIQTYRLAALTHDIGHYPYSHALEEAIENHYASLLIASGPTNADQSTSASAQSVELPKFFNHERAGKEVLTRDPQVGDILANVSVDPSDIYSIFMREQPPRFANLVSSDLDADRIDYLLRTACSTGLPYGSVDLDYLLSQMRVDSNDRICLTQKAQRTADHFLLCRYFDYQQVAFHKTVAAFELVLKDVLQRMLRQGVLDLSAHRISEAITNGTWYDFDDALILGKIRSMGRQGESAALRLKAQAIVERVPPKLLGEIEFVGSRDPQTQRSFRLQKQTVKAEVPRLSEQFGIDPSLFYVWDRPGMVLTKIGSHVPISDIIESSPADKDKYEQAIRIKPTGSATSRAIMEIGSSLMSVLADYALYSLRLYVLFPPGVEAVRDQMTKEMRKSLPDVQWT